MESVSDKANCTCGYLEEHGVPRLPHDLQQHQCVVLLRPGMTSLEWAFRFDGIVQTFRVGYQNVLCETVIMHLEPASISEAITLLIALLRPGGTLYVSWQVTENESLRDKACRLYASFDRQLVILPASEACAVIFKKDVVSASSGKRILHVIFREKTSYPPIQPS